jgi:hypothetical protein
MNSAILTHLSAGICIKFRHNVIKILIIFILSFCTSPSVSFIVAVVEGEEPSAESLVVGPLQWVHPGEAGQVDVVFKHHDVSHAVFGVQATRGVGHHQRDHSAKLHHTNWHGHLHTWKKMLPNTEIWHWTWLLGKSCFFSLPCPEHILRKRGIGPA